MSVAPEDRRDRLLPSYAADTRWRSSWGIDRIRALNTSATESPRLPAAADRPPPRRPVASRAPRARWARKRWRGSAAARPTRRERRSRPHYRIAYLRRERAPAAPRLRTARDGTV